ncbi:MAG: DUF547 domain-containing protein [Deltaproteobacteria bacterium]|nr:DUF547 domain-containing protein [Deltaproteobacteria bacterium]MBW2052463.1 DUF547 domain-containing protein [Deltaproteobacteria bacterium]MBW2142538.1 DUF547 domain-containing protein [Deltaproteobacteria bacterium]MBW2324524.1 DUF547 domain-containing protein [Deltaproteobacteria bacterium]
MKYRGLLLLVLISLFLALGSFRPGSKAFSSPDVDYNLYEDLLKQYVVKGVVNYRGFKDEEAKLDKFLQVLEETDISGLSRDEQFAFYVNAYNAWTIKLILSGYPGVKSIKDLGSVFKSPWKKKIVRIGGDVITLNDLEHGILRPQFKDPRIHFAVNCASKSCPIIGSERYLGSSLNKQLDDATRNFLNDSRHNRLEGQTLYVSEIFKWYDEDFNEGVVNFFLKYAEGDLKKKLEQNKAQIKIKYIKYDWSLNGE